MGAAPVVSDLASHQTLREKFPLSKIKGSRKERVLVAQHELRCKKAEDLRRVSTNTLSRAACVPETPLKGVDVPSSVLNKRGDVRNLALENLPSVNREVLLALDRTGPALIHKINKLSVLFGGGPVSESSDGWKGTRFLERVSLAAHAASGVSRFDIQSKMHAFAASGDAKAMKVQSAVHRAAWILGSGSRLDAQLSFVGRALPSAENSAVGEALLQHRLDYTSNHKTPDSVVDACRAFVRQWAKTRLVGSKVNLLPPAWPSGSSCFERTARNGGTMSYVLEQASRQEPPTHYPVSAAATEVAMDISQFSYALKAWKEGHNPLHRVACITERGLKTRVVNVGPAWCQVLGHSVRKRLLKGLKATPGAYQPLVGAKDEDIFKLFEGCSAETLVSTDLTRATDLLPFDLVKAVVDGLEDSGKLSKMEIDILRTLTGPQDLIYPGSKEPVTSSRGILMGLPTSWCVLSLIHLYWMDVAKAAALASMKRSPRIRFAICGDDALLAIPATGAAAYQQIVKDCGGEPSKGKHYECTSGPVRRGVFLERLYEWRVQDGKLTQGIRFAAIPVKGLTSKNLPRDFMEDRLVSCRSFGLRQILTLDSLLEQNTILRQPLEDYIKRRVPWLAKYAKDELDLIGGFPLRYGGFAFSPRPSDVSPMIEVRDSGRSFSIAVQRELDPAWRMAVSFQERGRELAVTKGELVDLPLFWEEDPSDPTPPNWVVVSEDDRFIRTVTFIYRQILSIMGGAPSRRTIHLRASDFRRSLKKIRAEGRDHPSGLGPDVPIKPRLIRWRLPNGETPEQGLSWYDATEVNRSVYESKVFEQLLEHLGGVVDCYKGAFKRPSEALRDL
jgi:hypothetical protein